MAIAETKTSISPIDHGSSNMESVKRLIDREKAFFSQQTQRFASILQREIQDQTRLLKSLHGLLPEEVEVLRKPTVNPNTDTALIFYPESNALSKVTVETREEGNAIRGKPEPATPEEWIEAASHILSRLEEASSQQRLVRLFSKH